jgi:hypothetical protein
MTGLPDGFAERLRMEHDCTRLIVDFARFVDLCEPARCAQLFTEDGVYERRGERIEGRAAIEAALAARAPTRVTRHLVHNVSIERVDDRHARGYSVFTMYGVDGPADAPGGVPRAPLVVPSPLLAEFLDTYRLTPQGWRIARRTGRTVFRPA